MIVFTITSHQYDIIWKDCIASHQTYCNRHGYTYHHIHLPDSLSADSTAWSKLHLLRYFLNKNSPWVMYVDADCQIQHDCPAFETVNQSDKYLFVAPGFSGRINSGVIIAHHHASALEAIDVVIDNRKKTLPDEDSVGRIYGGGENGHIIHYRKNNPIVALLDQRRNNNHTPSLVDYIRHYSAGGPMRSLYTMDMVSRLARYRLMTVTYCKKILRKIGCINDHTSAQDDDLDAIVKALMDKGR